jgi:hypothetical protein
LAREFEHLRSDSKEKSNFWPITQSVLHSFLRNPQSQGSITFTENNGVVIEAKDAGGTEARYYRSPSQSVFFERSPGGSRSDIRYATPREFVLEGKLRTVIEQTISIDVSGNRLVVSHTSDGDTIAETLDKMEPSGAATQPRADVAHSAPLAPGRSEGDVSAKEKMLFDPNSTAAEKLAVVKKLASSGRTSLQYQDTSGHQHQIRLELEAVGGGRQMVHMFSTEPGGKERAVLRGIFRADGQFEQERDRYGNCVSYEGEGYSRLFRSSR